jgi:asparaginyl-tRNA synthetase
MYKNLFITNNRATSLKSLVRQVQTKSISDLIDIDFSKSTQNGNIELDKTEIRVVGWVKSVRDHKEIKFVHLIDGVTSRPLQLVYLPEKISNKSKNLESLFKSLSFNSTIEATGILVKSTHPKQNVELHIKDLSLIGECDANSYVFKAKAKYTLEQIRPHTHLRTHVEPFASIMRFRSRLTHSVHEFFMSNRFTQVHTPVITSNNCEGGCETFQVCLKFKRIACSVFESN